jgi:L-threonylcarbamoyladenylate synthase
MKYRHYAPTGALTIVQGGADAVAGKICRLYDAALAEGRSPLILALDGHVDAYGHRRCLPLGPDAEAMARSMFARLRDADALGADAIFSEAIPADGVGLAVMNRLERAAGFNIIQVED